MAGKNVMNKLPAKEKQVRRSMNVAETTFNRITARGEYGNSIDTIINFVLDRLEDYEKKDKKKKRL